MNIVFEPLVKSHFSLLLTWLETPHVKAWWDQDVRWTKELIAEKYGSYTKYTHIFADPDIHNIAAIKAYTRAGFETIKTSYATNELWMLRKNTRGNT